MQSSGPKKYNQYRTDEVMREAACKAAEVALKFMDEQPTLDKLWTDKLKDIGVFIRGCAEAMLWPDDKDETPDFDSD